MASRGMPTRRQVWWSEAAQKWVGNDVPDFKADSKPADHMGPFIMNPEGVGRIFAPLGAFAEGPFPEFYEPTESPLDNLLHPQQSAQSGRQTIQDSGRQIRHAKRRLHGCLHHLSIDRALPLLDKKQSNERAACAGAIRRNSGRLAAELGVQGGEKIKVSSIRGEYIAKAMVTKRIKPMLIDGKKTYQVGFPIHWGYPRNRRR